MIEMPPELMIVLAGQIIGTGIQIGLFKQTQREHAKQLDRLETEKLDKAVHEAEISRLDGTLEAVGHHLRSVDTRVNRIETRRS